MTPAGVIALGNGPGPGILSPLEVALPRALPTLLTLGLLSAPAYAARVPLEPQTRVHAGVSVTGQPDFGVAFGLDARMTRLIFMDLGAFVSPVSLAEDIAHPEDPADALRTRHGLYATPGVRIPHAAREGLTWDAVVRGGIGAIWVADLTEANPGEDTGYTMNVDPAAIAGADLVLRKGKVGGRVTGKAFVFTTLTNDASVAERFVKPVGTVEAFYQW